MMEHFLDARGLICPLPVLKARKVLLSLQPGDTLRVSTEHGIAGDRLLYIRSNEDR